MDDESIIFIISSHLLYNTQRELFKFFILLFEIMSMEYKTLNASGNSRPFICDGSDRNCCNTKGRVTN